MPAQPWYPHAPDQLVGMPVTTAVALDAAARLKSSVSAPWRIGTRVQVRNRFDGSWVSGFEVVDATAREPRIYSVRRRSDRTVLPASFGPGELRPEKEGRTGR